MSQPLDLDSGPDQVSALARFRAIFEGASIGIARIDAVGHAYEANGPCQVMLGYSERELRDLTFADLIHPDHLDEQLSLHAELMAGKRQHYELEKRYLRKDGSVFWAQTRIALIPGSAGDPPSAIAMIQDVTERKLADLNLRANRDRLALIVETQRDIVMAGNDLDQILQLIVERSMVLTRADGAVVSLIDGDDLVVAAARGMASQTVGTRRRVEDSIAHYAFQARAALLIEHTETDARINPALHAQVGDRSLISVPLLQGDAPVASLIVMRRSATDRLGEEELQTLELVAVVLASAVSRAAEFDAKRLQLEALARFEATYASALVGMMMLSPEGEILDANPAMHHLLGAADGEVTGHRIGDFLPASDWKTGRRQFRRMEEENRETMRLEHRLVQRGGEVVWVDVSLSSVRDAEGEKIFDIALMQDITQRKAAEAALLAQAELNEYQALHDDLTDLPNRTLFRDRLGQAVEAARRQHNSAAVLVMDLDGFKEINDSLGHAAGDEVLVELSRRLETVMRASDTAARLGGDEFVLLLPDVVVPEDVLQVVARVRAAFERPLVARGVPVAIAASIGISLFPGDGDAVDALVHAADVAMYRAKRTKASHVFHHDLVVEPLEADGAVPDQPPDTSPARRVTPTPLAGGPDRGAR